MPNQDSAWSTLLFFPVKLEVLAQNKTREKMPSEFGNAFYILWKDISKEWQFKHI